jgi:hypothetical protein
MSNFLGAVLLALSGVAFAISFWLAWLTFSNSAW